MRTVVLSELTWPEIKYLLQSGQVDTAVIAVGATEQHGHHLPLGTDAILAQTVGEQVARGLGRALLAPPVVVGRSDHHMAFPGSLTLREETLAAVLEDYVTSLEHHGFANIVIVPTHGGNFHPLAKIAEALRKAHPEINAADYTDLDRLIGVLCGASAQFDVSAEASGAHSGESETSMLLALRPDLVQMDKAKLGFVGSQEGLAPEVFARGIGALDPDGVLGDPRLASAAKGEAYVRALADDVIAWARPRLHP